MIIHEGWISEGELMVVSEVSSLYQQAWKEHGAGMGIGISWTALMEFWTSGRKKATEECHTTLAKYTPIWNRVEMQVSKPSIHRGVKSHVLQVIPGVPCLTTLRLLRSHSSQSKLQSVRISISEQSIKRKHT